MLHVEDNGIGIPAEYLGDVFGLFRGVPGEDRGGTGIGLALVARIAETLGGEVWLDSTVGTGTVAHLRLAAA